MDIAPTLRFADKAGFLAWEEEQETRFEFDGEDVTEVTGGTLNHVLIMTAIARLLHTELRGTAYLVVPQIKVETVPGYRYPDVTVGLRDCDHTRTVLPEPVAVFEVLSPSTSAVDLGRKWREYRDIATIRRYVLVDSRRVAVQSLARDAIGEWTGQEVGAILKLPEIGVSLAVADIYEDARLD